MAKEPAKKEILIVRPVGARAPSTPSRDRLGGEEHGVIASVLGLETKPVESSIFSERLCESIASATDAVRSKVIKTLGEFSLEEIKISLAVTAEGDIGIASAGVEASIEVTLKSTT